MFEVTEYRQPHIFVTNRRTGETYKFLVGIGGAVAYDGAHFDQEEAGRTAIAYLAQRTRTKATEFAVPA